MNAAVRTPCLPGTRTRVLEEITKWIVSSDGDHAQTNIFWLHGPAGTGKSTVATTIAQYFYDLDRLGAYVFCERATSDPTAVLRTLAYKLAHYDASIGAGISESLHLDPDISISPLESNSKTFFSSH